MPYAVVENLRGMNEWKNDRQSLGLFTIRFVDAMVINAQCIDIFSRFRSLEVTYLQIWGNDNHFVWTWTTFMKINIFLFVYIWSWIFFNDHGYFSTSEISISTIAFMYWHILSTKKKWRIQHSMLQWVHLYILGSVLGSISGFNIGFNICSKC